MRDLKAAYDYLASQPNVNKNKIGDIGWCMGGGYSIELAEREPRLAACVVNYGALPADADTIQKIQAPVLENSGADDRGISPRMVHAFEQAMKAAGKQVDAKVYPGAGHAFENPDNKGGYRPEAAADAWQRIVTFLAQTLGGSRQ
jgi:carboxymethylenebutenolidase